MNLIIPPFGIRERRAPPWNARATVEGWLKWELVNRKGRVTRGGEQHNLILDQGLDQIASYGIVTATQLIGQNPTAGIQYAAVGTDSTAPATTDTALGAELARTNIGPSGTPNTDESITRASDGVYDHVRTFEFDFAEAVGNLTEWGISPTASAGSNLYARELFKDGGGSPETISKTADDKLRLVYTRRTTITPVAMTAGSLIVTSHATVNGDYALIGGDSSGAEGYMDLRVFSLIATGSTPTVSSTFTWSAGGLWLPTTDQSGIAYTDKSAIGAALKASTATDMGLDVQTAAAAYSGGSYSRSGAVLKFSTAKGNFEHFGIGIMGKGNDSQRSPRLGFMFAYDPGDEWTKDSLHELRITLPTVTWARV